MTRNRVVRLGLLVPPVFLGVVAQASATALDADAVRIVFQVLALVCVVISTAAVTSNHVADRRLRIVEPWLPDAAGVHPENRQVEPSAVPKRHSAWTAPTVVRTSATVSAASDRRLPTIERSSGLLVQWYFILRVEEEIQRAKRYGQIFTVLTIETPTATSRREAIDYVTRTLRKTDLAGEMGDQIALLLVQTAGTGAEIVLERVQAALPAAALHSSSYPNDGTSASELLGEGRWWQSDLGLGRTPFAA